MSFGIVLRFEEALAQRLRTHTQALYRACGGVDLVGLKVPAHLTLTLGDDPAPKRLAAEVDAAFADVARFTLDVPAVGTFGGDGGVVFLAPATTRQLLDVHDIAMAAFARAGAECSPLYRTGAWCPHITVGHGVATARVGSAVDRTRAVVPLQARVVSIDLVRTDLEVRAGFDVLTSCRLR